MARPESQIHIDDEANGRCEFAVTSRGRTTSAMTVGVCPYRKLAYKGY